MIITIDYDLQNDFFDVLFTLRLKYLCSKNNKCKIKKSKKGYHVYLFAESDNKEIEYYIRAYLLDDIYRFDYDYERYKAGYNLGNVLYELKADNYISVEKDIDLNELKINNEYFLHEI
ncbi:MAG: hypothetical protein ACP5GJ_04605 [Nanopusillaceae archaeon]